MATSKQHLKVDDILGALTESAEEENAFAKRVRAAHVAVDKGLEKRRDNVHP